MRSLAIIFALLPGVAFAHEGHAPLPTKGATVLRDRLMLSPSAAKAIGVQFGKVELAKAPESLRAVGSVELPWSQQAFVSTLIAGRIEQVFVKPGEAVRAGQTLARVGGKELELLQLTMLQARTEMIVATRLLEVQEQAGAGIPGKILLQSRTELSLQTARFNVAWQKLSAIGLSAEALQSVCDTGKTVSAIEIPSPIEGIVSMADARTGQIVQPTEHLYHIVDPSRVWMVAKVLEADASKVKPGLSLECSFAISPDVVRRATIDHVELRLNRDRTLSVKAFLDNADLSLRPGMFGRVSIQLASKKCVVCPAEALIHSGDSSYALVEQTAGNLQYTRVLVGDVREGRAVVLDGLFPGDRVVTVGSHELGALFPKSEARQARTENSNSFVQLAPGSVELPTDQKAFASVPIEGRIRRILVQHGQQVQKGQVLAELDSLAFRTLQLELMQARASLTQASQNLIRLEKLGEAGVRKLLWETQAHRDLLRQSVESMRKQLELAGLSQEAIVAIEETKLSAQPGELPSVLLPIRAPADGLICEFEWVPGQVVSRQDQLFELHNPSQVWVRAFLFEQDAHAVKLGQQVRVGLASDPNFQATGRIERLDPILVSGNRALSVWTELENPDWKLREGMAAVVSTESAEIFSER